MVKTFQAYLPTCHRTYSCIHCRAHLANHDELISKSFQGSQGRAYLFNSVVNVGCGPAEERYLLTGLHAVADIYCECCKTTLGWKYEHAFESSQKYKEGKYIIELAHMIKENGWDWQHAPEGEENTSPPSSPVALFHNGSLPQQQQQLQQQQNHLQEQQEYFPPFWRPESPSWRGEHHHIFYGGDDYDERARSRTRVTMVLWTLVPQNSSLRVADELRRAESQRASRNHSWDPGYLFFFFQISPLQECSAKNEKKRRKRRPSLRRVGGRTLSSGRGNRVPAGLLASK